MAKLCANGRELLRVFKRCPDAEGTEFARMRAYFSKGAILHKSGWRRPGDTRWQWSGWKHLRDEEGVTLRRDIGLSLIADTRDALVADGWTVAFYGVRDWRAS